uniref:Testis expressed 9 n=1 Tax=Cyprinus carpio TaxID=7962 RepID=A0A8C1L7L2_CYPCA
RLTRKGLRGPDLRAGLPPRLQRNQHTWTSWPKKKNTSIYGFITYMRILSSNYRKAPQTVVDDVAIPEDFGDFSLAKTIRIIEDRVSDDVTEDHLQDDIMPSAGDEMEAQIRFLKAKLRVMQEELNRLAYECNRKDDENSTLSSKLKDLEEEKARLQRTTNVQQTQVEKQRALAEESSRKCEGLQQQVAALQKVLELLAKYYL